MIPSFTTFLILNIGISCIENDDYLPTATDLLSPKIILGVGIILAYIFSQFVEILTPRSE